MMPRKHTTHKKALLALSFVGTSLYGGQNIAAREKFIPTNLLLQRITTAADSTPEIRAYSFLRLADAYLSNPDEATVYSDLDNKRNWEWVKTHSFPQWIQALATQTTPKSQTATNSRLAKEAVKRALEELKHTPEDSTKLDLYFAASRILKKMGNTVEYEECKLVLIKALQTCEESKVVSSQRIRGCISACDWMAYMLIPVDCPGDDAFRTPVKYSKPFTDKEFAEAENRKLRAVALTDRLSAGHDMRRRAHRDLILWYTALGQSVKAEKQKQILFELVGIHDDRILYPHGETCGQLAWWTLPPAKPLARFCGMGYSCEKTPRAKPLTTENGTCQQISYACRTATLLSDRIERAEVSINFAPNLLSNPIRPRFLFGDPGGAISWSSARPGLMYYRGPSPSVQTNTLRFIEKDFQPQGVDDFHLYYGYTDLTNSK